MNTQTAPPEEEPEAYTTPNPYPPSWVDRLNASFRKSRVPALMSYFLIGVGVALLGQAFLWRYGFDPMWSLNTLSLAVGIWVSFSLAFVHYLDDFALDAIQLFRPALTCSEDEFAQLRYTLTTMPARPVILVNLATALATVLANIASPDLLETVVGEGTGFHPLVLIAAAALGVSGSLIYHTMRQLAIVRSVYSRAPRLSIFDTESAYAFSTLTVSTALAWVAILYLGVLTVPGITRQPYWLATSAAILLVIIGSLASVLMQINRKLSREKAQLLKEVTDRLMAAMSQAHQKFEHDDLTGIDKVHHLVQTLSHERDLLGKIPTWPWQPGTLVAFISALLTPVAVFFIQESLRRLARF